ncbi:acetyl-CoA C-acetyltransferase [Zavarzinia compransoris]|uniref:Acetyl-CoA C-acyltransferase n=1 Tax=Zavarzinia compransoris TaxID=1264899 RepID=A0A317E0M6_9PROT|nr:acetyl-CoA C-acetyltransferase [Zavarzinia compransoris]PWR19676.1 acetyl-CoA C-acyltransferase [Zavarzinia compransoris]TDP43380.1 acetyl-CoA C-acetyltransferase [Zavarzinia compransoris]
MTEAWIIDAARTPRGIGKVGKGGLSEIHPQRILSHVLKALAERNGLDTADVDDVIAGCGTQAGKQGFCIARMAALDAGFDNDAPGLSLDRFCGSGLTAVNLGAMGIMSGMQQLVVAGGVESMSYGATLGGGRFMDSGNLHLRDLHPQPHQGVCADLIATLDGFTREDTDRLALESQRRADHAIRNGYFDRALVPVYHDDGRLALGHDEFPRPGTTLEGLGQLKPAFAALYAHPLDEEGTSYKALVERAYPDVKIEHIHHAGNSSGVVDGAGAVILASPEYAKAHGLKPRARIRALATAGDSPELMLNAPVPATKKALALAGLSIKDIDLFEINEAFAVVPLKFMRDLDIDPAIVNVNGGAMALGHPIGATGAIILGTLLDEMERRDLSLGLATLCAAGGMAPATIIERM